MSRAAVLRAQADILEASAATLRSEADSIDDGDATPGLLTAREVAERLGLHINTVHRMLADGEIAATKVRGHWRVAPAALQRSLMRSVS